MIKLEGNTLWQWDTGRRLKLDSASEVHLSHGEAALVVLPYQEDGSCYADIPDSLLTHAGKLRAYRYAADADGGRTVEARTLDVQARPKPEDYVHTEAEAQRWGQLEQRVEALEGGAVDEAVIAGAVADYLQTHPLQAEETDPTVPAWAKAAQKPAYTAQDVGADPAGTAKALVEALDLPQKLPNPYALTVNGIAYDGSRAVEVTVEGGGGGAAYTDTVVLDITTTEDVAAVYGDPFNAAQKTLLSYADEWFLFAKFTAPTTATSNRGGLKWLVKGNYWTQVPFVGQQASFQSGILPTSGDAWQHWLHIHTFRTPYEHDKPSDGFGYRHHVLRSFATGQYAETNEVKQMPIYPIGASDQRFEISTDTVIGAGSRFVAIARRYNA